MNPEIGDAILQAVIDHPHHADEIISWVRKQGEGFESVAREMYAELLESAPVLESKDAEGHEHKGKGEGGGQFTSTSTGGGGGGEKVAEKDTDKDSTTSSPSRSGGNGGSDERHMKDRLEVQALVSKGLILAKPESRENYQASIDYVLDQLTPTAMDRVAKNLKRVYFYDNVHKLTDTAMGREYRGGPIAGMYGLDSRSLHIDGGTQSMHAVEIYAHELTHAIDGDDEFSGTDEWKECWHEEIDKGYQGDDADGALSLYARSRDEDGEPMYFEGFAEMGRALLTEDRDYLEKEFPKCCAFFKKHELI